MWPPPARKSAEPFPKLVGFGTDRCPKLAEFGRIWHLPSDVVVLKLLVLAHWLLVFLD